MALFQGRWRHGATAWATGNTPCACRAGACAPAVVPGAGDSLCARQAGESALVVGMCGGSRIRSRLESMGLVPGTEIRVVSNGGRGPLLISVGEGRLTVSRGIAEKIMVA